MQLPFVLADYLKGKTIYPAIRRLLSLIFSASITAYLFEKFYFTYSIPDISNYKLIVTFFLKGYFIIPFCIFIVVHGITYFIPAIFFSLYNYHKSKKIIWRVVAYEIQKSSIERELGYVRVLSKQVSPIPLNKETLIDLYLQFKDHLSSESLDELERECTKEKGVLELNFIFAFRAVVVISIFFCIISFFGWILFTIVLFCLIVYMILLLIGYRFYDIFPMALKKFRFEADKYVTDYINNKQIPQK